MNIKEDKEFIIAISCVIIIVLSIITVTLREFGKYVSVPKFPEITFEGIISIPINTINKLKLRECYSLLSCDVTDTPQGKLYARIYNPMTIVASFQEAENICKNIGMRIPTSEEAWNLWINSRNCNSQFKKNNQVVSSKEEFMKSCRVSSRDLAYRDTCMTEASKAEYTCKSDVFWFEKNYFKHKNSSDYYWSSSPLGSGNIVYVLDDGFSDGQSKYDENAKARVVCVAN